MDGWRLLLSLRLSDVQKFALAGNGVKFEIISQSRDCGVAAAICCDNQRRRRRQKPTKEHVTRARGRFESRNRRKKGGIARPTICFFRTATMMEGLK